MVGSPVELQTFRRIVVLPALARPITRIRNRWNFARVFWISSVVRWGFDEVDIVKSTLRRCWTLDVNKVHCHVPVIRLKARQSHSKSIHILSTNRIASFSSRKEKLYSWVCFIISGRFLFPFLLFSLLSLSRARFVFFSNISSPYSCNCRLQHATVSSPISISGRFYGWFHSYMESPFFY